MSRILALASCLTIFAVRAGNIKTVPEIKAEVNPVGQTGNVTPPQISAIPGQSVEAANEPKINPELKPAVHSAAPVRGPPGLGGDGATAQDNLVLVLDRGVALSPFRGRS